MTETVLDYYYAGKMFDGKKTCMRLVPFENADDLYLVSANTYPIGQHLVVTDKGAGKFTHTIGDKPYANDDLTNEWRLKTIEAEEKARTVRTLAKMKKDKMSIDTMTIREIKEYCKKGLVNRRVIRLYLEEVLW